MHHQQTGAECFVRKIRWLNSRLTSRVQIWAVAKIKMSACCWFCMLWPTHVATCFGEQILSLGQGSVVHTRSKIN